MTLVEQMSGYRSLLMKTEATEPNHDMFSGIEAGVRTAYKERNLTKLFYYLQARMRYQGGRLQGMVGYQDFINSWAGQEWFAKHKHQIEELEQQEKGNHMANFNKKPWFVESPKGMADREKVLNKQPNHVVLKTS